MWKVSSQFEGNKIWTLPYVVILIMINTQELLISLSVRILAAL